MIQGPSPLSPGSPFVRIKPMQAARATAEATSPESNSPSDHVQLGASKPPSLRSRAGDLIRQLAHFSGLGGLFGLASGPVQMSLNDNGKGYQAVLQPVRLTPEQRALPVSTQVLDRAQEQLDSGDRGGAYLTLYKELGNEQLLIQTQITTYTGIWGSGALTGNSLARSQAGERYNLQLDEFSHEIAQATIQAIRDNLEQGGTGRLEDKDFQTADRKVWRDKDMGELFPGNIQFIDFWNHEPGDRAAAIFSPSTLKMLEVGVRALTPNTHFLGLNRDGRNVANLVGKRPAEFVGDPNYTVYGGPGDRFITVIDKRTGFVEAFWDNSPRMGMMPMPQIPNQPLAKDSTEYHQRKHFYEYLGANRHQVVDQS